MNDHNMARRLVEEVSYWEYEPGCFIAWSLHAPAVPEYGDWALISFKVDGSIVFRRKLESDEIVKIKSEPFMVWGKKLKNEPWAIVERRRTSYVSDVGNTSSQLYDPKRRVGV